MYGTFRIYIRTRDKTQGYNNHDFFLSIQTAALNVFTNNDGTIYAYIRASRNMIPRSYYLNK